MSQLLGFHIICCTYGFWLPNDERGSGSNYVRNKALLKFGPATKVDHSRSVARKPFDPVVRALARESLAYPPVVLSLDQITCIGRAFAQELSVFCAATVFACAILRDHFHLVIGPCRYDARRFAGRMKGAATKLLRAEGIDPMSKFRDKHNEIPSLWSVKPWVVYEHSDADMRRVIKYVNDNVWKARLPEQKWGFVVPY